MPAATAAAPAPTESSGAHVPDEGLRARKKRATRRALRLAALSLVAEHGLAGVTVEEIAAAADVSSRTFFNYFTGKEDALVGSDPDLAPSLAREITARPAHETPLEALRAVFVHYCETVLIDEKIWRLRLKVIADHPVLLPSLLGVSAELERTLTAAVAARTGTDPDRNLYPSLVVNVAVAASRTALQVCGAGGFTRPLADMVSDVFDALVAGLPAPAADGG